MRQHNIHLADFETVVLWKKKNRHMPNVCCPAPESLHNSNMMKKAARSPSQHVSTFSCGLLGLDNYTDPLSGIRGSDARKPERIRKNAEQKIYKGPRSRYCFAQIYCVKGGVL